MNRTEYVKAVAEATGRTQKEIKEILDVEQTIAYAEMAKGEEVKIFEGTTLMGVKKDARTARNPLTGETVEVAAKTAPKAKFGKFAKDAVNA